MAKPTKREQEMIFIENRAADFLNSWPNVPSHIRPVYLRLYDAGLLWMDPQADEELIGEQDRATQPGILGQWPGQLRLTELGQCVIDRINDFGRVNYWHLDEVLGFLPIDELAEKSPKVERYIELFRTERTDPLSWNHRLVRLEIAERLRGKEVAPTRPYPRPTQTAQKGLKAAMLRLELAIAVNYSLRTPPKPPKPVFNIDDDDIPF